MKLTSFSLCLLLLTAVGASVVSDAEANIAVVVSKQSNIEAISKRELIDVFMGRFDVLESGQKVIPVDYVNGSTLRIDFYQSLVGKSERQINAYWSRLIFSGRATPPIQVVSTSETVRFLQENISALAYVPVNSVSEEMRIVLVLE